MGVLEEYPWCLCYPFGIPEGVAEAWVVYEYLFYNDFDINKEEVKKENTMLKGVYKSYMEVKN
jgi:hypothetical protein